MRYMVQGMLLVGMAWLLSAGYANAQAVCGPPAYSCLRTDLTIAPVPSVPPQVGSNVCAAANLPACGNLTGAGTVVTDPDFGTSIERLSDSSTSPLIASATMTGSDGGSGDKNLISCLDNRVVIGDSGGHDYVMQWSWGTPAALMYTGSLTGGFYTVHSQPEFARDCVHHPYTLYTVNNGVEGASSGYGSILSSWDFTSTSSAPSPTAITDFKSSSNCLGSSFNVTWETGGGSDQTDTDFAIGFSNNGTQGGVGALYVAVYRIGSGCRVLNLSTLTVTGDWGPTGAITGTTCLTNTIHNVKMFKVGGTNGAILVDTTHACADADASPYVWFYTGLTFQPVCSFHCSGHWVGGLTSFMNGPGAAAPYYWDVRAYNAPGTPTGIIPTLPSGSLAQTDAHFGWNALNDSSVFGATTTTTQGQAIVAAWQNEILLKLPTLSNPFRAAHCFNTGVNPSFSTANCIGSISADGKYYMFASDWLNTLGNTSGGGTCVQNGPAWVANTAYNSTYVLIIHPTAGNTGGYSFKATTPGTSGATQPVTWNQTVGGTTTDGTVTWTNIGGPANCRGDVFMVKLFTGTQTTPAPATGMFATVSRNLSLSGGLL